MECPDFDRHSFRAAKRFLTIYLFNGFLFGGGYPLRGAPFGCHGKSLSPAGLIDSLALTLFPTPCIPFLDFVEFFIRMP